MAIYHMSVKAVSRSGGGSAVAGVAYRDGEKMNDIAGIAYRDGTRLVDEKTGVVHDYSRRSGVEDSVSLLPPGAPDWANDKQRLWNEVEAAEKRVNSQVAREYELALPHELNAKERKELAVAFGKELVARYRVAVNISLHKPHREGDKRNYHAHIYTSTRELTPWGFGKKTRILDDKVTGPEQVRELREVWANLVNQQLEKANVTERVDHRSFEARGLVNIEPTVKMGKHATAMEREAMRTMGDDYKPVTELGQKNAAIKESRLVQFFQRQLDRIDRALVALGWRQERVEQELAPQLPEMREKTLETQQAAPERIEVLPSNEKRATSAPSDTAASETQGPADALQQGLTDHVAGDHAHSHTRVDSAPAEQKASAADQLRDFLKVHGFGKMVEDHKVQEAAKAKAAEQTPVKQPEKDITLDLNKSRDFGMEM